MKEKRDRWIYFASRKNDKFFKKIDEIGFDLDEKCVMFEKNIDIPFNKIIKEKNLKNGFYYDRWDHGVLISPISIEKIHGSSLIICRDEEVGLFLNHEGWLWVCKK